MELGVGPAGDWLAAGDGDWLAAGDGDWLAAGEGDEPDSVVEVLDVDDPVAVAGLSFEGHLEESAEVPSASLQSGSTGLL